MAIKPKTKTGISGTFAELCALSPWAVKKRRWRIERIKTIGANKQTRANFMTTADLTDRHSIPRRSQ